MKNPKIFFSVRNGVMVPVARQNGGLDNITSDLKWIDKQRNFYSDTTVEFIDSCNSSEMFWSDEYSWNGVFFDFGKLNECNDSDYEAFASFTCSFDPNKQYEIGKDIDNIPSFNQVSFTDGTILSKIQKEYPCPTISETGFYVEDKKWKYIVRNILKKKNSILVGPTGTGKTEIILRIAKVLGLECNVYDMGSMQDPLTDLLGSHRLENGSSKFDYAKFVSDVQKPGIIVLDELSRAPMMANNILFPCLDSRRTLPVEIADSKSQRSIKVHDDCVFVATANIGVEYSGTNEIDAALLNRFLPVQLDYMPSEQEVQVLMVRTGVDKKTAEKLINIVSKVRKEYSDGNITKSVSTRETLELAEMVVDGFSIVEAFEFVINQKYMKGTYSDEYMYVKKLILGF